MPFSIFPRKVLSRAVTKKAHQTMASELRGRVITVNGPIDPDQLGPTSMHEHVFLDMTRAWFHTPTTVFDLAMSAKPVRLENLWWIRKNATSSADNMRLDDYNEAKDEISQFIREGGRTMVDCTTRGLGGDPRLLRGLSNELGVNIIAGSGYYVASSHPSEVGKMTIAELEAVMKRDIIEGMDGSRVKAGIIGEIGVAGTGDAPMHKNEEKVLKAACRAHFATGAAISIHPPRRIKRDPTSKLALGILDLIESEGVDLRRIVICHMDRSSYEDLKFQREIAERGAYIEYDLWGLDAYVERYGDAYQHDMRRVFEVKELIRDGYADKLLFGHDVCMKIQRTRYGGYGYGHIMRDAVPMLEKEGVTRQQIDTILIKNPRDVLTFS
jgi:phosphotriesterase-related protein